MCEFFGISRTAYYVWANQVEQPDANAECMQLIQKAYEKSHKTYGYRRIGLPKTKVFASTTKQFCGS
jgi:hypothetical protein